MVMQAVGPLFALIGKAISYLQGSIAPVISGLVGALSPLFEAIGSLFDGIGGLFDSLGGVLTPIIATLTPLFAIIEAVCKGIGWVVDIIFDVLGPVFKVLGDAMNTISDIIVDIISWVVHAFRDAWNWVVDAIANFLFAIKLDDLGKTIQSLRMSTGGLDDQLAKLKDHSTKIDDGLKPVVPAAEKAATALNKFTDSITNAVTGFKVDALRYQTQDAAGSPGGPIDWGGGTGGSRAPASASSGPDSTGDASNSFDDAGAYGARDAARAAAQAKRWADANSSHSVGGSEFTLSTVIRGADLLLILEGAQRKKRLRTQGSPL
jgi:hypothetical protein